jgi:hypothetical protein
MSLPREVLPGHTCMITRRCSERRFLLRQDNEIPNAFMQVVVSSAILPSPNRTRMHVRPK